MSGLLARAAARPAGGRARADRVPWLIALAVFAAYLPISVFRYLRLDPTSWDLGIFTEYVKQYAHLRAPVVDIRGAGVNLLGDHFHPIVALIAPFFRVFPSPVTLLVAQALLAAVSVIPVSRAAADLLGTGAGRAIGAAYGFSWGLQQLVNYDFHEIAFAVPLLACSLSALVRGENAGGGAVGAPAGAREGGPGLHGRGHRARHRGRLPAAGGRAVPRRLGAGLVVPRHHRDHPGLQRRPISTCTGATAARSARSAATSRPPGWSAS